MFPRSEWDATGQGPSPAGILLPAPPAWEEGPPHTGLPPPSRLPSAPLTLSPLSSSSLKNQSDCRGDRRK